MTAFACCAAPHRVATTITNVVRMNFAFVIILLLPINPAYPDQVHIARISGERQPGKLSIPDIGLTTRMQPCARFYF